MRNGKHWHLGLLLVGAGLVACGGETPAGDELQIVPQGKADDYYSGVAMEYEVSGVLPLELTEEEFADEAIRADRAIRRVTALGLYLTAYVTDKFLGIDHNGDGEISEDEIFFHNMGYGGFSAMVRNQSASDLEVTGSAEAGYQVSFTLDLAGPKNMLSLIPAAPDHDPALGFAFDLRQPKGATMDPENVTRSIFRAFDPDKYEGELETVRLAAKTLSVAGNAYPDFADFVADGLYDLTLFFGHDYNESRSDLKGARSAFSKLKNLGFSAPVATFEELGPDSGPFTRTAQANGQPITVEARLFHSDMFIEDRQAQHDLALSEVTSRDVFFYMGHAGPYFGFYLDEAREATVNYWEFADAPFKAGQQLVLANGCQTYSQYGDMLYASPVKSEANLDVITTVNYSYGQGSMELLETVLTFDSAGNHQPQDFYKMVGGMNDNWINSWKDVFYGVMGIEGNPRLHPYANVAAIGESCAVVADCGDAAGNVCVKDTTGARICGAVSLDATGCPMGTTFAVLASGSTVQGGACF